MDDLTKAIRSLVRKRSLVSVSLTTDGETWRATAKPSYQDALRMAQQDRAWPTEGTIGQNTAGISSLIGKQVYEGARTKTPLEAVAGLAMAIKH